MSVIVVATAFPAPDHRAEVIAAFEAAEHGKGAGLAQLREALAGKLAAALDVQVLTPHPAGTADKGAL